VTLSFEHVADGSLFGANVRFEAGCWPVVGASVAPLSILIALAAGAQAPARGRVSLAGSTLYGAPRTRRLVGSLLAYEALPPERDVESAVGVVLKARGDTVPAKAQLRSLGLESWSQRAVADLDRAENRSLALGLALGHEQARLLVLYEPFSATHALAPELVRERILERAQQGVIVLVATTSYDLARSLGGVAYRLDAGMLRPASTPLGPIAAPCSLTVRTPDAERLIAAISDDPAVAAARHDPVGAPNSVFLHGQDLEALALAVGRAALRHALSIDGISSTTFAAPVNPPDAPALTTSASASVAPQRPPDQSVTMPTAFADPARPPDQSVTMPTAFADPARPPDQSVAMPTRFDEPERSPKQGDS
jgi:ABC-type taurine transport system ATPase subunit